MISRIGSRLIAFGIPRIERILDVVDAAPNKRDAYGATLIHGINTASVIERYDAGEAFGVHVRDLGEGDVRQPGRIPVSGTRILSDTDMRSTHPQSAPADTSGEKLGAILDYRLGLNPAGRQK